jgi:hypothetical protein
MQQVGRGRGLDLEPYLEVTCTSENKSLRLEHGRWATNSLPVALNRRINTILPTCTIYGAEIEDDYHAMVSCRLARALRDDLRQVWELPPKTAISANWPGLAAATPCK